MERLYQAARELKGIKTPTELARVLNQSPQTIKNWESRGISNAGMIKAQGEIGCSVTWLETGKEPMLLAGAAGSASPGQEDRPELVYVDAREMRLLTRFREAGERGKRETEILLEDIVNDSRAKEAAAQESDEDRVRREGTFNRKLGLAPTATPEKQRRKL